jgi:hypothetical protein
LKKVKDLLNEVEQVITNTLRDNSANTNKLDASERPSTEERCVTNILEDFTSFSS